MHTEQAKKVGGDVGQRDGAFSLPKQGGQIVGSANDGPLADIEALSDGLQVEETSGELQVAVCDRAGRVVGRDDLSLQVWRPLRAPQNRCVAGRQARGESWGWKPDSTGSGLGCVVAAVGLGSQGDNFLDSGGPTGNLVGQPLEIVEGVMDALTEVDSLTYSCLQCLLKSTEETSRAWESERHGAELAKKFMPLLGGHSTLVSGD